MLLSSLSLYEVSTGSKTVVALMHRDSSCSPLIVNLVNTKVLIKIVRVKTDNLEPPTLVPAVLWNVQGEPSHEIRQIHTPFGHCQVRGTYPEQRSQSAHASAGSQRKG